MLPQELLSKLYMLAALSFIKQAHSPVIDDLLTAKQYSDKKQYDQKHAKLRALLDKHGKDFFIDSSEKGIVGLTHRPSGFRIHAPLHVIPPQMREPNNASNTQAA